MKKHGEFGDLKPWLKLRSFKREALYIYIYIRTSTLS